MVSRLLTPTQASLARSKSAATLSTDGKDPSGNRHVAEVQTTPVFPLPGRTNKQSSSIGKIMGL